MAEVDLTGVTRGSFSYFGENFFGLIKVTLFPVLGAAFFGVAPYLFFGFPAETIPQNNFSLHSLTIAFLLFFLAQLCFIWSWVRATNYVYGARPSVFATSAAELKSTLFSALYAAGVILLFSVAVFCLALAVFLLIALAGVVGGHFMGFEVAVSFLFFIVLVILEIGLASHLAIALVSVARGNRPNLFGEFFQNTIGNSWGLMGRFLLILLFVWFVELLLLGLAFVVAGDKFLALRNLKAPQDIAIATQNLTHSLLPLLPIYIAVLWFMLLIFSVFGALAAQRYPHLAK